MAMAVAATLAFPFPAESSKATTAGPATTTGGTTATREGAERGSMTSSPSPAPPNTTWLPTISQDFDTPAALGQFAQVYPGWADYDTYHDTHRTGLYDSSRVVSVADGILSEHLHSEAGQPLVVSITPVPHVQTYGRYEVRFRADVIPGYKIAWLLWPADDQPGHGEIDFPEAWLDRPEAWVGANQIMGYSHDVSGDGPTNQFSVHTGQAPQAWHTAVIEWLPDSLTFILDGVPETTTNPKAIPQVPMYWSLQSETNDTPSLITSGNVQIDYVRAWAYNPTS
jgi:hypothetical protein